MMAASFWSLLIPAIEAAKLNVENEQFAFISVTIGLVLGIAFVFATERCLPDNLTTSPFGSRKNSKCKDIDNNDIDARSKLDSQRDCEMVKNHSLSSSIEIDVTHQNTDSCTYQYRITSPPKDLESSTKVCFQNQENAQSVRRIFLLVIVIMVHNIPEGLAGQFSGIVEPLATLPAALGVMMFKPILPYAYSSAAGAMIYVVFDDLMPEAQSHGNGRIASLAAMIGFIVMMILEIGLE
uniref:Zinc transporter ZIP11 n=1 Tax=Acrobeloides nanus TaxID=290746 RepID=A0A914E5J0_9BILA